MNHRSVGDSFSSLYVEFNVYVYNVDRAETLTDMSCRRNHPNQISILFQDFQPKPARV